MVLNMASAQKLGFNDKLHARGPVGLEGLTSLKYVVFGHGEVRRKSCGSCGPE